MLTPQIAFKLFKTFAIIEAITWAGLLVGMFLKYVTDTTERGVQLFGPIHGTVFILYVLSTLLAIVTLRWNLKVAAVALLAAVPPFGTLLFERWLEKTKSPQVNSPTGLSV